jgi:hypothetical protein
MWSLGIGSGSSLIRTGRTAAVYRVDRPTFLAGFLRIPLIGLADLFAVSLNSGNLLDDDEVSLSILPFA